MRRKRRSKDPRTPDEWQHAVNAAAALRMIADCKMYGLIDGGPDIDVDRCDVLVEAGAAHGIRPNCSIEQLAVEYVAEFNRTVEERNALAKATDELKARL